MEYRYRRIERLHKTWATLINTSFLQTSQTRC